MELRAPRALTSMASVLGRRYSIPPLERLSAHVRALSPGDKAIAYALGLVVVCTGLYGVWRLERSFLVEVPAYGGSLHEGEVGSPRFVNPLLALSDADRDLTALTFAGLLGVDGQGRLVPVLASGYTVSEDGKTYTFTIRPNAEFSDGTPVTASDVVFTVQKAQDPALKSPQYADWSGVAATALDARTVQFTLAKAYAPFLYDATLGILPARLWKNVSDDDFPFSTLNTHPVGAGPFQFSSLKTASDGTIDDYTVTAFRNYALGRPYLDSVRFTFYASQDDLAAALANGSVESGFGVALPGARTAPYSRVFGVFWNPDQNPAFARPEVRKALSIAIDRDDLVKRVLGGYAVPIMGPVPPGSGITQTPVPESADPIADAAAVLENAGWKYDADARQWTLPKQDLTLSMTLKTSNVPELKAVANALQADWQKLGVATDVELYEPGDLSQNVIRPRKYDALLFGMVIGRDDDLYAFWDSSQRSDPGLNIALYANHTVDGLLESARAESDPAVRHDDLQKINDDISADYPAAFAYAPDFLYVVPKGLRGVSLPQIASPSDRFAGAAAWYRSSELVWPIFAKSRIGSTQ
jgi:peptide/nickel transport system substrate-binding protein